MSGDVQVRFCEGLGVRFPGPTHLVLVARTEAEARAAWEQLQAQFADLQLVVNQEKSRLATLAEGFAFLGFEFPESARAEVVDVATRQGVPPYSSAGRRSSALVPVEWAGRPSDPETEPDSEWVVHLFPSRQQQPGFPQGGLGRPERIAVMAPAKAPVPLADC